MELKPTLQQLFDTVQGTCKAAVAALEALPRLVPEVLAGCAAAGPLAPCLRWVPGIWSAVSMPLRWAWCQQATVSELFTAAGCWLALLQGC